jgi:two-component system nitrate/nitrite response regulator NarL
MKILVVAEAPWIREQLEGGLAAKDIDVMCISDGRDARQAIVDYEPDVMICDMQSGNMGGIAVTIDARMEAEEERAKDAAIILLLDREADRVLAERANVDATMVKPIDIFVLGKLVRELSEHIENARAKPIDDADIDDEPLPVAVSID